MQEGSRQPNLMPAVLRDVRETLGIRWVDTGLQAASGYPVFFTAAWSAIRPNVGPTFIAGARAVREIAVTGVRDGTSVPDHRDWARRAKLEPADLSEITTTIRAFHETTAKVAIVMHALVRAARGRPAGGSGVEEPPPKRGVPSWHPRVSLETSEETLPVLEDAAERLASPVPPDVLLALGPWPGYLQRAWKDARRLTGTDAWRKTTRAVRRATLEAVRGLPHVISLQWSALKDRGFTDEDRRDVGDLLASYDAAMPRVVTLVSYLWLAAGSPQGTKEG
jgi:hypothetical protein